MKKETKEKINAYERFFKEDWTKRDFNKLKFTTEEAELFSMTKKEYDVFRKFHV